MASSSSEQAVGKDIMSNLRKMNEDLLGDIRSQVAGLIGAPPARTAASLPLSTPSRRRPIERATTRTLAVRVRALPKLNYALLHAGLPLISAIELSNADTQSAEDLLLRAWVAPDYGEAWQTSISSIPGRSSLEVKDVEVPLRKARLQEVREAERASLRVDVFSEGKIVQSVTQPLQVLAYNEWYFHPAIPHTAACFVQPNSSAVETITSLVRDRLRRVGADPSMSGYQEGGAGRVMALAKALYETLQQDLKLSYINPPPSFEHPELLDDGDMTISQKVFLPEQILKEQRGTCLDLAFLGASCLERMGLNPIFFLVPGHAFFGVWLEPSYLREPWTRDGAAVRALVNDRRWLPLNSTTFTANPMRPMEQCRNEAVSFLSGDVRLEAAVDITAARQAGIKPVPPLL
ncbi:MAG TPA: hypothetical protein VN700_07950 [Vicinamibacterales bacterium]|nr:hypothetical protein [Vicinamibacterales bacterium]